MSGDFLRKDLLEEKQIPFEDRETSFTGQRSGQESGQENTQDSAQERAEFLRLMRKMVQWEPGKRSSAGELLRDEWIERYCSGLNRALSLSRSRW